MPNAVRGEMELVINGTAYRLVPEFHGLCEIEDRAGMGLYKLCTQLASEDLSLRAVVAIIYGGIVGAHAPGSRLPVTYEQIGKEIAAHGYLSLSSDASKFLADAMTGPKDDTATEKKT